MRTKDINITFTIPFPIETPDENGFSYSKEAVEEAVNLLRKNLNLPIIYKANGKSVVIGHTTRSHQLATWDNEHKVCEITISGVINYGGTECKVNEVEGEKIKDFQIISFGFSV